jgi:monoamine oxidase
VVELGGQWGGPTQDRVLELAEELGVGLFPIYIDGEHFLAVDHTKRLRILQQFRRVH